VSAVDANYFDYYRSENDAVTGRGLLNHVVGGLGLFGSAVVIRNRPFLVGADVNDPLEGYYERLSGAGPRTMQLYVTGKSGERTDLSGNYNHDGSTPPALLGTIDGSEATIAFLRGQIARDTVLVIEGRFNGEKFEGEIRGTGAAITYRRTSFSQNIP
jgi:hypothetical protein